MTPSRERGRPMANRHAFTTSVEASPLAAAGHVKTGAELMAENPYRPWPARITSIMELTATEKLFEFRLIDERIREAFHQQPGQFVELSIFGVGEAPISISSSPSKQGFIELCVRRAASSPKSCTKCSAVTWLEFAGLSADRSPEK